MLAWKIFIFLLHGWFISYVTFWYTVLMPLFVLVSLLTCPKPVWWHILCMTFIFLLRNLMGTSFCLQCSEISWCYWENESASIYCAGHLVDSFSLEINVLEFWKISWNICLISSHVHIAYFLFLKRLLFSHQASQRNPPVSYFYFLCLLLYSWGFAYFYLLNSSTEIFIFLAMGR